MRKDIDGRLEALGKRRLGNDRKTSTFDSILSETRLRGGLEEAYVRRAPTKKYTRYALGAMQAVDKEYTQTSKAEAERVQSQLIKGLSAHNISVEFRLQGSVACDIHIRGASDVDFLVLDKRFISYDSNGLMAMRGEYKYPLQRSSVDMLSELRWKCEMVLESAFYGAQVDTNNAKAITLSQGSLKRSVDIVPANWHDTEEFQRTEIEADRGVEIFDKRNRTTISNTPFKHIEHLNRKDKTTQGALKKAIRLCKNIKADAEESGESINLTSFDIASLAWHIDNNCLTVNDNRDLTILGELCDHFTRLLDNRSAAESLWTPDRSRKILDSSEKFSGLKAMQLELSDLATRVAEEQAATRSFILTSRPWAIDELRKAWIPN